MSATSRTKSSSFLSYWKEHKIKKMGTDIAYALFTNSVLHYLCHISYARHLYSYPFSNIRTFSKTAKGAKHFISKKTFVYNTSNTTSGHIGREKKKKRPSPFTTDIREKCTLVKQKQQNQTGFCKQKITADLEYSSCNEKCIAQIEYSRHWSFSNFIANFFHHCILHF